MCATVLAALGTSPTIMFGYSLEESTKRQQQFRSYPASQTGGGGMQWNVTASEKIFKNHRQTDEHRVRSDLSHRSTVQMAIWTPILRKDKSQQEDGNAGRRDIS